MLDLLFGTMSTISSLLVELASIGLPGAAQPPYVACPQISIKCTMKMLARKEQILIFQITVS